MLQIGELARLAGVSTRTVRHYHHLGLLPEPARTANGYRSYGVRALSRLIQIRRLGALGLSLAEIADALDAGTGTDTREMLRELDAELAAREADIRRRRDVIAQLLEHGDDPTLSPGLAAAVRDMGLTPFEVEALRAAETALPGLAEPYRAGYVPSPAERACAEAFAELADADADDPRVEAVARRMATLMDQIVDASAAPVPDGPPAPEVIRFGELMIADLSRGQRRAMALMMELASGDAAASG
jgi:DNA-binding transcriptional MerR regulator